MSHYMSANISKEVSDAAYERAQAMGISKSELYRRALNFYIDGGNTIERQIVNAVEEANLAVNVEEEEDSMNFNSTTDVRLHKNESGSISIIGYDRITGEKLGTIVRLQNDGTLRRIKNHTVPAFVSDDEDGRISVDDSPMLRNLNR